MRPLTLLVAVFTAGAAENNEYAVVLDVPELASVSFRDDASVMLTAPDGTLYESNASSMRFGPVDPEALPASNSGETVSFFRWLNEKSALVGREAELLRSTSGGTNWARKRFSSVVRDADVGEDGVAWVCTDDGVYVLDSRDRRTEVGDAKRCRWLSAADRRTVWMLDSTGLLYRLAGDAWEGCDAPAWLGAWEWIRSVLVVDGETLFVRACPPFEASPKNSVAAEAVACRTAYSTDGGSTWWTLRAPSSFPKALRVERPRPGVVVLKTTSNELFSVSRPDAVRVTNSTLSWIGRRAPDVPREQLSPFATYNMWVWFERTSESEDEHVQLQSFFLAGQESVYARGRALAFGLRGDPQNLYLRFDGTFILAGSHAFA
ncbi:MAG: hypothetical protein AAF658_18115, partial [Myxococcota bacterium]